MTEREKIPEDGSAAPELTGRSEAAAPDAPEQTQDSVDRSATATPSATEDTDYEQLAREDVRLLAAEFSELGDMKSLSELPDPLRYATLRDLGLTPQEAYRATAPRTARYDNRAHLHSSVPRAAHTATCAMNAEELSRMRELLDGVDDATLQQLYRRVTT